MPHMAVFTSLLDDHILPVVARLASSAREASDPMEYLKKHEGKMLCMYACTGHTTEYPHYMLYKQIT